MACRSFSSSPKRRGFSTCRIPTARSGASPPAITDGKRPTGAPTWADFDNDGDLDLYLRLEDRESLLFRNLGLGASGETSFQRTFSRQVSKPHPSWGDYDNDGYLDLFINMYDATGNHVLRNNRDGTLSRIPLAVSPPTLATRLPRSGETTTTTVSSICSFPTAVRSGRSRSTFSIATTATPTAGWASD